MGKPHIAAIPYLAQGHVIPMMEVAQCLANNGVKVTFLNTKFDHEQLMKVLPQTGNMHELRSLVSIPDGLESWEDRTDLGKLPQGMAKVMPGKLEDLMERINGRQSDKVTCVLTDVYMAWPMQVAEKFCIKRTAFLPSAVVLLALAMNAEKLVDEGIVDSKGAPLRNQLIQLSPSMPEMSTKNLAWTCFPDLTLQKIVFESIIENNKSAMLARWVICNSYYELEPGALSFVPNCLPIGLLLASSCLGKSTGYFWPEDLTCLAWLDQQPTNSVIYVAFRSFTVLEATQFQELASGLELTKRPFLSNRFYPTLLVACSLGHCSWNSTIESISNGITVLCRPYFAEQFLNQSYIADHWKAGFSIYACSCVIHPTHD